MAQNPIPPISPQLRTLLPLLYVAWADRRLSPAEVRLLRDRIDELDYLSDPDRRLLRRWTNPARPPGRELFQRWYVEIRNAASDISEDSPLTLAELGLEMARQAHAVRNEAGELEIKQPARIALRELEEALGPVRDETYRSLFPRRAETFEKARADFPTEQLQLLLDDEYHELREELRELLSTPEFRLDTPRLKEDYRRLVRGWAESLAERGYGALAYPGAQGGEDDMGKYAAVFEMLGYHDLSLAIKFGVQFGLFGGSIQRLGTEYHHHKYLAAAGTLELPGCFAMTETGHGSNVRGLETTITYLPDSEEFEVNTPHYGAGKEYIGNALHGRMASVFGQLIVNGENHGVHAILVPIRNEGDELLAGITFRDNGYKLGLNGVDNGRLWFDRVRVPRLNLLDRFGSVDADGNYHSPIENPSKRFFTMLGTLVGGRVCVPRAGLSAAKKGLTIAVKHNLRRRQFAPAPGQAETLLLDYPNQQRRLMPHLAKAYALDFALTWLSGEFVAAEPTEMRRIETLAAGLKSYATWFTTEVLQECREATGGKGYLAENRLADLKADTDIFTTFEGDNNVLMQLVAKGILSEFNSEFGEEGMIGVMRFLAGRTLSNLRASNPFAVRNTEPKHLRSRTFQREALAFRTSNLTYSVASRLRRKIKGGMKSYEAFLLVQTQLVALANAYIEEIVLLQFQARIKATKDPELRRILKRLSALYALHAIEKDKGWYFEYGYLTAAKSKAIRREVDRLCAEVRDDASGLVAAFGIPDALLAATIATV